MRNTRSVVLLALGLCVLALSPVIVWGQSSAQTKSLENIPGTHGYDPVAFFTQGKAIKGDPQWQSTHDGVTYYFQSKADRDVFNQDPAKYAPQYGGYCAMSMTMGKFEDVDPNYSIVHDNKLLMQKNEKAHDMFVKDIDGNIKKADANWEKLQNGSR
jgi:YHS domain-containing protein